MARDPEPRRDFFRSALRSLFQSVDEVVESQRERWRKASAPPVRPVRRRLLRPPGALPEAQFLEICQRSHECLRVCPARAIQELRSSHPHEDGTPWIVPSERACVVCDDLSCMKACPSGALRLVPREGIAIGLARVDHELCHRTAGDACTECVDLCPYGVDALTIDDAGRVEVRAGCTGCGVCEASCPARPRAIQVYPC